MPVELLGESPLALQEFWESSNRRGVYEQASGTASVAMNHERSQTPDGQNKIVLDWAQGWATLTGKWKDAPQAVSAVRTWGSAFGGEGKPLSYGGYPTVSEWRDELRSASSNKRPIRRCTKHPLEPILGKNYADLCFVVFGYDWIHAHVMHDLGHELRLPDRAFTFLGTVSLEDIPKRLERNWGNLLHLANLNALAFIAGMVQLCEVGRAQKKALILARELLDDLTSLAKIKDGAERLASVAAELLRKNTESDIGEPLRVPLPVLQNGHAAVERAQPGGAELDEFTGMRFSRDYAENLAYATSEALSLQQTLARFIADLFKEAKPGHLTSVGKSHTLVTASNPAPTLSKASAQSPELTGAVERPAPSLDAMSRDQLVAEVRRAREQLASRTAPRIAPDSEAGTRQGDAGGVSEDEGLSDALRNRALARVDELVREEMKRELEDADSSVTIDVFRDGIGRCLDQIEPGGGLLILRNGEPFALLEELMGSAPPEFEQFTTTEIQKNKGDVLGQVAAGKSIVVGRAKRGRGAKPKPVAILSPAPSIEEMPRFAQLRLKILQSFHSVMK